MKYLESSDNECTVLFETGFDKHFELNKVSYFIPYSSFKQNRETVFDSGFQISLRNDFLNTCFKYLNFTVDCILFSVKQINELEIKIKKNQNQGTQTQKPTEEISSRPLKFFDL